MIIFDAILNLLDLINNNYHYRVLFQFSFAIILSAIVGFERRLKSKPVGSRTCIGIAIGVSQYFVALITALILVLVLWSPKSVHKNFMD